MSNELAASLVVLVFVASAAVLALGYTVLTRFLRRWQGAPDADEPMIVHGRVSERWEEDRPEGVAFGVTIEQDDGTTVELYLAGSDHARLAVGDVGTVRYTGERFRGFTADPRP